MNKSVEWCPNEEWRVLENWNGSVLIYHRGITVEASPFQIQNEIYTHRYHPKYFLADDQERREMIAKALWTRLQKHQALT